MNKNTMPANQPPEKENVTNMASRLFAHGLQRVRFMDIPIPAEFLADPERTRRAKLVSRFGLLGALFGLVYATFYMMIGHKWGVLIILVCSSCFAIAPFLMHRTKSIELAGNLLSLTLTAGFTALCFVEGGVQGHAIAWLVSVPLCALLLLGQRAATRWAVIAFLAATVVVTLNLTGVRLPVMFDAKWNPIVSAAGYLGLIAFMFFLGIDL